MWPTNHALPSGTLCMKHSPLPQGVQPTDTHTDLLAQEEEGEK